MLRFLHFALHFATPPRWWGSTGKHWVIPPLLGGFRAGIATPHWEGDICSHVVTPPEQKFTCCTFDHMAQYIPFGLACCCWQFLLGIPQPLANSLSWLVGKVITFHCQTSNDWSIRPEHTYCNNNTENQHHHKFNIIFSHYSISPQYGESSIVARNISS